MKDRIIKMDWLSDIGCFAYYFNSFILVTAVWPDDFAYSPIVYVAYALLAGGLSLLASHLLLRIIDLHFSEVVGEPESRSSVLNLPVLLQLCLPRTCWGYTLYVVFMACIMTPLVREFLRLGLFLYVYTAESGEFGWGGLFVLFAVGILMGSSLSLQTMEGVQIGCVLLNVIYQLCNHVIQSVDLTSPFVSVWQRLKTYTTLAGYQIIY